MQRSPKVIAEEIDEANERIDAMRFRAKSIFEAAKSVPRELTTEECREFDGITDKKRGTLAPLKNKVQQLQVELMEAEQRRQNIAGFSIRNQGQGMQTPNYGQFLPHDSRVLDRDNLGGGGEVRFSPYNRIAKLKAFKGPDADHRAYAAGMWLRAVIGREFNRGTDRVAEDFCAKVGLNISNVGLEGTGSTGGYTVPAPLSSTIIDIREEVGVARRIFNIQPMSSDTLSFPKLTTGLTVYYVGEASAITPSDVAWGQVELIAKKRAVAHQISQELVDDSIVNIVDFIFKEMAYALAAKEDAEAISGDSTATYGGVTGLKSAIGAGGISTCATGHDTWAEIDLADIMAWIALLPDRYQSRNPKIVCSSAFYHAVLLRLAVQAGGNTLSSLMGGPGGTRNFLGYEVLLTSQMPTTTAVATVAAFFGAYDAGAILAERSGIRIGRSDDYAFLNDVTTIKATSRYDIEIFDGGTASVPGCYVGLKTAA